MACSGRPRSLNILTTNSCNLNCPYCEFSCHTKGSSIPFLLFEKLFTESLSLNINQYVLDGGEFLVHPDALKILNLIGKLQLKAVLLTNGVKLLEFLPVLKRNKVNEIIVGLDNINEKNDAHVSGKQGLACSTLYAIQKAKAQGFTVGLHMVLSKDNIHNLGDYLDYSQNINATPLLISNVNFTGRALKNKDKLQLTNIMKLAARCAYRLHPHPLRGFFAYRDNQSTTYLESLMRCKYFNGQTTAIDWNGDICFCAMEPSLGKKRFMSRFPLKNHSLREGTEKIRAEHESFLKKISSSDKNQQVNWNNPPCLICYKYFRICRTQRRQSE